MSYTLAVFDLDGTILDTLEDLRDSLNVALRQWDCPARSLEEVRRFVGNGIRRLIERAVPEGTDEASVEQVYQTFMPYYQTHYDIKTRPYDGIVELVARLREAGVQCAVVSNKADPVVSALCRQYFPGCFALSVGERPGVRRKPAPDAVNAVLEELNVPKEQAVYIGDSEVDLATAQNVGMDVISVTWGFRDKAFLQSRGATVFAAAPWEVYRLVTGAQTEFEKSSLNS